MIVKCYNQLGKVVSQTRLPSEIFGQKLNSDLVHQVAVSQMANRRRIIACTKDRGEVRGGGRKPWRQKGTGRARVGSIRSPLWRGGGVTFGPTKERVFKKKIPKKMRRKALFMVLSQKLREGEMIVLDKLNIEAPKTKEIMKIIKNQILRIKTVNQNLKEKKRKKEKSVLIILPEINKNIILSARNIPKVKTIQAKDLNVLDLLNFKYVLMPKEAVKVIKETFITNSKLKAQNSKPQPKTQN